MVAEKQSDGTDDSGNEYELSSEKEEKVDNTTDEDEYTTPADDPVISQLQSRATDLAYSISNPATLSKKLRESLIDIVGSEASVTYHLGATFDSSSKEVKFQIARISPSMAFKLQSDLKTTEVGFSYIKTVNGWRVAVGLTATMEASESGFGLTRVNGLQAPSGSKTTGEFFVTVSR